jgi:NADH dehydrogenase [ubiquinone] 1 alpha subcomplex assembly factor 7
LVDLAGKTAARFGGVMGRAARNSTDAPPLAATLRERIAREGPISVHDYMAACLADAHAGYYPTRQPIGRAGDFITAPEVSQIFGELIGVWIVAVWQSMGRPRDLVVAELGPGRGTLMADALRAIGGVSEFPTERPRVALIETSPVLREVQRKTLAATALPLHWYARLDDLPDAPLIVVANEFIDALPIRQVVREHGRWHERAVTLASHGFAFCTGTPVDDETLPAWVQSRAAHGGEIVELRPAASTLLETLAARAKRAPVAALLVDYGHAESGSGDTLQAVARHSYADPLAAPGEADLTAHVDFAALKHDAIALGLSAHGPMPQGEFLLKLGLGARLEHLLAGATQDQKHALTAGAARLADLRQMGILFKALALQSSGLAPPPPFGDI